jgi:hypothetical protein
VESWIDGCLGEGAAAERAVREARRARDARTRGIHTRIATDESRHAELAWDILRWAVDQGGSVVRDAVGSVEPAPEWRDEHVARCTRRLDAVLASR